MREIRADALLTPDREVRPGAITVDDDGYLTAAPASTPTEPLEGILLPGTIDLQCNGTGGRDLVEATDEAFDRVGRMLLEAGTTAYCPTLPSAPADFYPRFLDAAAAARTKPGPRILGVHLEGPYLNPVRAGAHDPRNLRSPDLDGLGNLLDRHPDLVRLVTLAPELPGALELIGLCVERGVTVALGHTDATEEQAAAAFEAGATMVTHMFNAMAPLHHRQVGVIGAALANREVGCSLIADGFHVHPTVATFAARALGPRRGILVSDAVAHPRTDRLVGGFSLLDGCVANLSSWGIPFRDAVAMATATAADAVGAGPLGRLEPGAPADAVLWRDGKVAQVWLGGEPL